MSGGSRVSIPGGLRRRIPNIKEITGNHSDDEVHAMLKECGMDPNETTQKLLLQEPPPSSPPHARLHKTLHRRPLPRLPPPPALAPPAPLRLALRQLYGTRRLDSLLCSGKSIFPLVAEKVHAEEGVVAVAIGSSSSDAGREEGVVDEEEPLIQTVECRICQEEDHIKNLESPCACSGSLKMAMEIYTKLGSTIAPNDL